MRPSSEKELIAALRTALTAHDTGDKEATHQVIELAKAVVAIADADDAELSGLIAKSAAREALVPQTWLKAFVKACEVDGMSANDRRAIGVDLWHKNGQEWQTKRQTLLYELGTLDGAAEGASIRSFIAERDLARQRQAA